MKKLLVLALFCWLSPDAFAQHRGGMRGGFRPGPGFGGGVHRGFAPPSVRVGGYHGHPGFGVRGYYGGYGFRYSYPAFVGGFSWGSPWYSYPAYYPPAPPVTVVYLGDPYRTETMGPVIVNRSYEPETARPVVVRSYMEERPVVENRNEPPLYLIARKDDSVIAAIAYWVDGDTLHYVDRRHEPKQIRLDEVDRGLSEQLNRERRVDFRLPR